MQSPFQWHRTVELRSHALFLPQRCIYVAKFLIRIVISIIVPHFFFSSYKLVKLFGWLFSSSCQVFSKHLSLFQHLEEQISRSNWNIAVSNFPQETIFVTPSQQSVFCQLLTSYPQAKLKNQASNFVRLLCCG